LTGGCFDQYHGGVDASDHIPTSANVGDSLCIKAVLQNNSQTTLSSISGTITVSNQDGKVVYETQLVPFEAGSMKLTYGNQLSFQFLWNTTQSYQGVTPQAGVSLHCERRNPV
jgi:hypothetical protein